MSSPAERYAAAQERNRLARSPLGDFTATIDFELDEFQHQACLAVQDGQGVLVAAPTGAGKTVVGEFAVHLALESGRKAFYTTPIKALSNQKYLDLCRRHGAAQVGLLTGDTSINSDAPVLVMTTEVLRNMLYASSPALEGLGFVVMDEVHYLADRFRGPVWEEVILHLADQVQVISLSATVSNAEEFGQWLSTVRGDTAVIVAERRPVPLWQHVMVGGRLHDLYAHHVDPTDPGTDPPISPDLIEAVRTLERPRGSRQQPRGRGGQRRRNPVHRGGPFIRPAPRPVVIDQLDRAGLLPAIVFIFSRAGCQAAVAQVLASGFLLTSQDERDRISEIIDERCADLPREDLEVLDFWSWSQALRSGVAAHHAGLLPVFKETVEALFTAGLVKVVFATETLALGINMPARSVVLERLVKWDGQAHVEITPGEYTQLTGRAGRRGIDVEGHAVVLYTSGVDPVALAGLASKRTYPLRSSFRPTYNMAVNLIARAGADRAREVLETSFAQFQADRGVVGLARRVRTLDDAMAGYAGSFACHLGDFEEYMDLRSQVSAREAELSSARSAAQRQAVETMAQDLRPGDVIAIPTGRRSGYAVVLQTPAPAGLDGPVLSVITADARLRKVSGSDLAIGTQALTRVRIGSGFNARKPASRRDLASSMREALGALAHDDPRRHRAKKPASSAAGDRHLDDLRRALRAHPCHGCADREEHARWFRRWDQVRKERAGVLTRIEGRTSSIARDFDRVCDILVSLGYLEHGPDDHLQVTERGSWLRRLYSEKDLVLAECLRSGAWDDLDAAGLAGVVAAVLYQSRSDEHAEPALPGGSTGALATAVTATARIARQIGAAEADRGLRATEPIDRGLVRGMYRWARGSSLESVLEGEIAAGDFVRWSRQVLDVLDQLTLAAPSSALRRTAREAIESVRRGIVAHGTL